MSFLITPTLLQSLWEHHGEAWQAYTQRHHLKAQDLSTSWQNKQRREQTYDWQRLGLSDRLASIADLCPLKSLLVDIGTDHVQLPIALLRSKKVQWAMGVDIHYAPLQHSLQRLQNYQTYPHLLLMQADGFTALEYFQSLSFQELQSYMSPSSQGDLLKREQKKNGTQSIDLSQKILDSSNQVWPLAWYEAWSDHQLCASLCGMGGKKILHLISLAPLAIHTFLIQANLHHQTLFDYVQQQKNMAIQIKLTLDHDRLFVNFIIQRYSSDYVEFEHIYKPSISSKSQDKITFEPTWYTHHSLQNQVLLPLYLWYHYQNLIHQLKTHRLTSKQVNQIDLECQVCLSLFTSCLDL
jgi:tRNA A22 N-methylase